MRGTSVTGTTLGSIDVMGAVTIFSTVGAMSFVTALAASTTGKTAGNGSGEARGTGAIAPNSSTGAAFAGMAGALFSFAAIRESVRLGNFTALVSPLRADGKVALKLNAVAPHNRLPSLMPSPLVSPNSTTASACNNTDNSKYWSNDGRSATVGQRD